MNARAVNPAHGGPRRTWLAHDIDATLAGDATSTSPARRRQTVGGTRIALPIARGRAAHAWHDVASNTTGRRPAPETAREPHGHRIVPAHHPRAPAPPCLGPGATARRLEVEDGASVEFDTVDASGGQLGPSSTALDLSTVDFARVNPVSGPVFVRGARPGDVLEVEVLELAMTAGVGPP
jgi:hypothetical protein